MPKQLDLLLAPRNPVTKSPSRLTRTVYNYLEVPLRDVTVIFPWGLWCSAARRRFIENLLWCLSEVHLFDSIVTELDWAGLWEAFFAAPPTNVVWRCGHWDQYAQWRTGAKSVCCKRRGTVLFVPVTLRKNPTALMSFLWNFGSPHWPSQEERQCRNVLVQG